MVRGRKTRAATTANLSSRNIEDKCCASPKRKDCRLDNSVVSITKENFSSVLSSDYKNEYAKNRSSKITNYFHVETKPSGGGGGGGVGVGTDDNHHDLFNLNPNHLSNHDDDDDDVDENARNAFSAAAKSSENGENTNIFLQAPVLHLNIDKSPNQPSSIIINKHIDFATLNTSGLVSFPKNTLMVTSRPHFLCDKVLRSQQRTRTTESEESSISSDSNSCDSGVVVDKSIELSPSKRRKPTTPHRILCPSPVKHVVPEKSPSSQLSNLIIGTKKTTKSRRRLNVNQIENGDEDTTIPAAPIITKTDPPIVDTTKKTILNIVADPTAQQNTNNNHSNSKNTKLKDFFPVRRSVRKTKKAVEQEQLRNIEAAIRNEQEDGLEIKKFTMKGRGVVTTRPFGKGEFVVEYIGDLIDIQEANQREQMYAQDENTGCYMYYFKHKNQQYCIDATPESGKMGRLVNHSRNGNLITKTVFYRNRPHLVLIAKEDINAGEELTYDYGDRSREALQHHPWLAL